MPEKPRRVLEKSRTVRRRYQRSNKRFQFTASQIERIEREEERERRAAKLREKEKKLREKKKRKAEKEAKAREERKRLGLPDPNAPKVSSSQPLLLNFFGAKKPALEEQRSDAESSDGEESGDNAGEQDATEEKRADDDRTDADRSEAGQDSDQYSDLGDEGDLSEAETVVMDNEETVNAALKGLCSPDQVRRSIESLGDSFEDDTSRLLQELLPDELGIDNHIREERTGDLTPHCTSNNAHMREDEHPVLGTMTRHLSYNIENGGIPHPCLEAMHSEQTEDNNVQTIVAGILEPSVDIYQDPEDILAGISTQDLADDDDDCDDFNNKENLHPNILPGARPQARATPHRPKPYSKLQTSAEREPLSLLNRETSPKLDDELCKSPSIRPRQDIHKTAGMSKGSTSRCFSAPASHLSRASPSKTGSMSDDEFDDLDLTPSELEALTAL